MRQFESVCVLICTLVISVVACAGTAPAEEEDFRLSVLLSQTASGFPTSPEDLVSRMNSDDPVLQAATRDRLGNPISIRPLTTDRSNPAARAGLRSNDPKRLLDSYVILQYSDAASRDRARAFLAKDSAIAFIAEPTQYTFSSIPNDPLYPYVGGAAQDRQWGMRTLNLEYAWNYAYGPAYVGILDNGIQEDHEDLQWAYRPHFSSSFISINNCYQGLGENQDNCGLGGFTVAGHGTMVAGIVAASHGNGVGVAGACRNCSIAMGRIARGGAMAWLSGQDDIADGINGMVTRGMQIINLSLKAQTPTYCVSTPSHPMCLAIEYAQAREVLIVAAAGNDKATALNFPASDFRVVGVGGTQANGGLWDQQSPLGTSPQRVATATVEIGTNSGYNMTVVAPARDVLSTAYTAMNWNAPLRAVTTETVTTTEFNGGTVWNAFVNAEDSPYNRRYGIGTGTSFAAPHVTGVLGLLRGANPLLSASSIKNYLTSTASRASSYTLNWGYGVPNADAAAAAIIATNSRKTPLFALYSATYNDYLLTIVPQMGSAAVTAGLLPKPTSTSAASYSPDTGNATLIAGYSSFPGIGGPNAPRARLKVFTTKTDASGVDLCHIFRYSYADATTVRHVYAVCAADRANINTAIWKYDGVEGYVYPPNIAQPSGTVKIYRWVKPSTATYMLIADGDQAYWTGQGFVSDGTGSLGYAYLN